LQHS